LPRRLTGVAGFDDAPFAPGAGGKVQVVGTVYAGLHLNGVLVGEVEQDGQDGAEQLAVMLERSRFAPVVQLVMLQGIALGGFNVVDPFFLEQRLARPVLVVSRKLPDLPAIREALLTKVPGGWEKWALIERLGPMEPVGRLHVQRVGLTLEEAAGVVQRFAIEGWMPEPLRVAHLIAGALVKGQSRGRA
jgi:hypothetical protein